jgi:hypothetical protein
LDQYANYKESGLDWHSEWQPASLTREGSRDPPVSLSSGSIFDSPSDPNAQQILQRWDSPAEDGRDAKYGDTGYDDPYNFD